MPWREPDQKTHSFC
jgi:IS30 family transposase